MSLFNTSRSQARLLVVQNSKQVPGGLFCQRLEERGARLTIIKPFETNLVPRDETGFNGLIVLGGEQHALDDDACPYFQPLMELMRRFDRKRKPVAGICLGCQLLARAHGGELRPLNDLEFGFVQVHLTDEGKKDPVLGGVGVPPLMSFHEDTFDLPPMAIRLMEGDACQNQGFAVGNTSYGFQPHLEVDFHTALDWVEEFRAGRIDGYDKYRVQFDKAYFEDLLARLRKLVLESEKYCDIIAENWLALTQSARIHRISGGKRPP